MEIGYDIEERERSYEMAGVTGHVTKNVFTDVEYPFIVMDMRKIKVEQYKMNSLNVMFTCVTKYNEIDEKQGITQDRTVAIYLTNGKTTNKIGKLHALQVKAFLDLFGVENLSGRLSENKELNGFYLYALAD